jgi:CrcB protein
MTRLLWIGLGGGCGTLARYLLATSLLRLLGPEFPWGTLAVNVLGSFSMALLVHVGLHTEWLSTNARLALGTGLLGGFTTYSSFNQDTLGYVQAGRLDLAALNLLATVGACLLAGLLGLYAGRLCVGP